MHRIALTIAAFGCLAFLGGCASYQSSTEGFNLSQVDHFVTVNKTTVDDVRALFGTPTVMGTSKRDGKTIIGYAFVGNNASVSLLKNLGKMTLTYGIVSNSTDYTVKNLYFKFDNKNRVTEIKKNGYAYLAKSRITFWNECEFKLTDAEVNSSAHYAGKEICKRYAQIVAKSKGISEESVDTGEEFPSCDIACHNLRGATEFFGKFKEYSDNVKSADGDGSRSQEIFGTTALENKSKK